MPRILQYRAHLGFDLGFCGMNVRYFVLVGSLRSPVTSTFGPDPGVAWAISCPCGRDTDWTSGLSLDMKLVAFGCGTDMEINGIVAL